MRNPGRKLLIWLALAARGWAAIAQSFAASRRLDEDWLVVALGISGAILIPFGMVYAVWALALLLGRSKLRRGHGLLGRWHLSDEEWPRFTRFDPIRAASGEGLANDFQPARQDSSRGIDVLIGETGVAIGGIGLANALAVVEAGASGIAVISDVLRDDPERRTRQFVDLLRV